MLPGYRNLCADLLANTRLRARISVHVVNAVYGSGTFKVTQNDMGHMECLRLLSTELNEGQRAEAREFLRENLEAF